MSDEAPPLTSAPPVSDAGLDATHTGDRAYLHQLGYRQELRRALGFFSSFAVQWTCIAVAGGLALSMGAGIVQVGGVFLWAWIIGCTLQMIVGLSIAEGVSAYPLAGGSYQIINRIIGGRNGVGWQVGWWLIVAHIAAVATEAYGIAPFILSWFNITLTGHWQTFGFAVILIVLSTVLNLTAVKIAAAFNNTVGVLAEFLAIGIVIIGVLVAVIFTHAHFNSVSVLTSTDGVLAHGQSSFLPFLFALLVSVFVISGFDVNGTAGEETAQASRNVPRALLIANFSTFAIGTVIVLFTSLLVHSFPTAAHEPDIIRYALAPALGSAAAEVFEILIVVSLFVNMMILQLTAARVMWAQARDGQMPFPRAMTKLSKDRIPITAVIVAAVIGVLLIVYTGLLTVLISMTAILWAAGYAVVVAVLIYAKRRNLLPDRPFRNGRWSPLVDWVALIWSLAFCVILIKSSPKNIGWGFAGTIAVGLILYYVLIPARRRGILRDVRDDSEIDESDVTALEARPGQP
jgi:amino acid transporter